MPGLSGGDEGLGRPHPLRLRGGLLAGWVQKEHNGRPYFVNTSTGVKTWARPTEAAAAAGRQAGQQPWVKKHSAKHKRPYWTNSETGERTWKDPAAGGGGGGGT